MLALLLIILLLTLLLHWRLSSDDPQYMNHEHRLVHAVQESGMVAVEETEEQRHFSSCLVGGTQRGECRSLQTAMVRTMVHDST